MSDKKLINYAFRALTEIRKLLNDSRETHKCKCKNTGC